MSETKMEKSDKLVLTAGLIVNEVRTRHPKYRPFLKDVKVKVKDGLGLAAACAIPEQGKIYLNEDILAHEATTEADFRDTVLHEIGHVIANRLATGNVGHSVIWRSVTRKIGGTGSKNHSLAVSDEAKKDYEASLVSMSCPKCKERNLMLDPRRAMKMLSGQQGYICGECVKGEE